MQTSASASPSRQLNHRSWLSSLSAALLLLSCAVPPSALAQIGVPQPVPGPTDWHITIATSLIDGSKIMTIEDVSNLGAGKSMEIEIVYDGGKVFVYSPNNKIQVGSGDIYLHDNISIPADFSGVAHIIVKGNAGDDNIHIGEGWGDAGNQKMVNLTVHGGTGNDALVFDKNCIFRENYSLMADFTDQIGVAGNDFLEIRPAATVTFQGATGSATVKTHSSILIEGALVGGPGGLTLKANEAGIGSGAVGGVAVTGTGRVQALGNGDITIYGRGADTGSVELVGVLVEKNASIISDTGDIFLTGFGGSNPAGKNRGIAIQGQVTSAGGDISLTGTGVGAAGDEHFGVYIERLAGSANGIVFAGDSGNVTVTATGSTFGGFAAGLVVHGGAELKCEDGDMAIVATGGGAGSGNQNLGIQVSGGGKIMGTGLGDVTITATGGNTTGNDNQGVRVKDLGSVISTNTGDLNITGNGNGSGNAGHGVVVLDSGTISSSGLATVQGFSSTASTSDNNGVTIANQGSIQGLGSAAVVTVRGTGRGTGTNSPGVLLVNLGYIISGNQALVEGTASPSAVSGRNGIVLIPAVAGTIASSFVSAPSLTLRGTASTNLDAGVSIADGAEVTSPGSSGTGVSIETDLIFIGATATLNGNALPLRIAPKTAGHGIRFGGNGTNLHLGIQAAGLNRCSGTPVIIGSATSGDLEVRSAVAITTTSEVRLQSGGSILLNNPITHSSGTVSLFGGSVGIRPLLTGTEVTATNLNLSGKARFAINGTTANTSYEQLAVAGAVQIASGTTLELEGIHVPGAGTSFILINNDGSSDAVVGTFAGLAESASVTFNGVAMYITYAGGDGNDVELVEGAVGNLRPRFTPGPNQTISNTTAAKTVLNWATNINDGDGTMQALTFSTSNNNSAIFSVAPVINSSTGTLTYTPSSIPGTATVTVTLTDDGTPPRSSVPVTFTITVNPAVATTSMLDSPLPSGGSTALGGTSINGATDHTEVVYQSNGAGTSTYLEFDMGNPKDITGFVNVTLADPTAGIDQSRLIFDTDGTPGFNAATDVVVTFDAATTGSDGSGRINRFPLVNAQFVRWEVISATGANLNLGTTEVAFLTTKSGLIPINNANVTNAAAKLGVGYESEHATNGAVGLSGIADVGYASNNLGTDAFVDFDLGSTLPVAGFDFFDRLNQADQVTSFDLIFSNSPDFSSPVVKSYNKTTPKWTVSDSFTAVNARYIRFDVTGAPSGQASGIGEIIFYATAPGASNLGPMPTGNASRDITFDYSGHSGEVIDVTAEFTLNPAHPNASNFYVSLIAPDGTAADFFRMNVIDNTNIGGPYLFNDGVPASRSLPLAAESLGEFDTPPAGSYHPYYGPTPAQFRLKFGGKSITGTWIMRFQNLIGPGGNVASAKLTVVASDNPVPEPVSSALGESVVTGGNAPDPTGADSGLNFGIVTRSGYIAENGNLAFASELTGSGVDATNFKGFWKHDGTSLKRLARTGDNAPETGATAAKFSDLPLIPGINDDGQVTLFAQLATNPASTPPTTGDNDTGLWSELGGTGFQILIRESDQIPGLPAGILLGRFGSGCFATAKTGATTGQAAFTVTFKGGSTDSALLRTSIIGADTTAVSVVARENAAAPGAGENFGLLNGSYTDAVRMDAQGNIAFGAVLKPSGKTSIYYQPVAGGLPVKAMVSGDAAPGTTGATFLALDLPIMGDSGTFSFRGVLNAVGDNTANDKNDGIWRGTVAGGFSNILRRGDSALPGMPGGSKVGNVWQGWLNNSNHGAWLGWVDSAGDGPSSYPADTFGIYTDLSGTMKLLISSGDTAPGMPVGATMYIVDHPVVSGKAPNEFLAFLATVTGGGTTADNKKGIWRSLNGAAPTLVLRTGDSMTVTPGGSKVIADIDIPGSNVAEHVWETPVMDAAGRLLVNVSFTDGTTTQVIIP